MSAKLTLAICVNYSKEALHVIQMEELHDVEIIMLPNQCTRCMMNHPDQLWEFL